METVPELLDLFRADAPLRKLCGKRMHQNQAETAYFDPCLRRDQKPAFMVVTRRSVVREDVLSADDRSSEPDEESLDVEIASGDPETTERIASRVTALLDGKDDLVFGGREAQVVEVTEQDEGFVSREELIALGYDVASMRIGIFY